MTSKVAITIITDVAVMVLPHCLQVSLTDCSVVIKISSYCTLKLRAKIYYNCVHFIFGFVIDHSLIFVLKQCLETTFLRPSEGTFSDKNSNRDYIYYAASKNKNYCLDESGIHNCYFCNIDKCKIN